MRYDVLIIGGGVTGCAIARQLARWKLSVALLEAREDVAMGASRANSAIVHAGYDAQSGTLMAAMNVRGNALYDSWCRELEVPLQRIGSLVIAFDEADEKELKNLYERGVRNGVPRTLAYRLAAQTVIGAGRMVLDTGEHPGALKDAVCSPGGTTIEGVAVLERRGLRAAVIDAVTATVEKTERLKQS